MDSQAAKPPLHRVVYVSRVSNEVRLADAEAIAERSAARNARDAITGFLLYTPEYFVQVLEGERSAIEATLTRIAADPRHSDVRRVSDAPIAGRDFAQWSMGFAFLRQVLEDGADEPPERWGAQRLLDRLKQAAAG